MSDNSTIKLIEMYMEEASAPMFLSGFFRSPPQNFHTSEKIEIDVIRDDEDIAIVLTDLSVGPRHNESTKLVNKGFTPPVFDEQGSVHAYDLIKRSAGQDPFMDPNYGANATREAFRIFRKLERKIRRTVELMASQVLQTGAVTLTDAAGNALYTLDYQAKDTHKVTVTTTWATDGTTGDPLGDLASLATVVRRDGKSKTTDLILGTSAIQRFLANAQVRESFVRDGTGLGNLAPAVRGEGATFQGRIWIGHYQYNLWMYDGFYRDPVTGNHVDYVSENNVIMLSQAGRLDLSFGAIPMIARPEQRALPFLPSRLSSEGRGLDLSTNAWLTPDGKHLMVSCGTRPLTIPTAIDTFACLTCVAADD